MEEICYMEIKKEILIDIVHHSVENSRDKIKKKMQLDVQERAFYSDIILNLEKELCITGWPVYSVDSEYNKAVNHDYGKGVGVYNEEENIVEIQNNNAFDIVVHLSGEGNVDYPENLIHIEVKKRNNRQDREKDEKRLLSTTKFPDKLSTQCLGMVINPEIFMSFYNSYQAEGYFAKRARQLQDILPSIEKENKEIYRNYIVNPLKTDIWFSNIIAGYQLGAFIDIGIADIKIIYYYSGQKLKEELINYA